MLANVKLYFTFRSHQLMDHYTQNYTSRFLSISWIIYFNYTSINSTDLVSNELNVYKYTHQWSGGFGGGGALKILL